MNRSRSKCFFFLALLACASVVVLFGLLPTAWAEEKQPSTVILLVPKGTTKVEVTGASGKMIEAKKLSPGRYIFGTIPIPVNKPTTHSVNVYMGNVFPYSAIEVYGGTRIEIDLR
jgi:hypothetical protein